MTEIGSLVGVAAFIAAAVVSVGSALQGAVGFGLAMICAPVLVLIDPGLVPGPLLGASLLLTLLIAYRERDAIDLFGLRWGVIGRLPGTALGAAAVVLIPRDSMSIAIGAMVLLAVAMSASGLRIGPTRWTLVGAGFLSGFMGTTSSIGGPPIAIVYQHAPGAKLRGTLSGYFVIGAVISLVALAAVDRFGLAEAAASLVLVPGVLLGFAVSGRLAARLDRGNVRGAVLTVSAAAGVLAIASALI